MTAISTLSSTLSPFSIYSFTNDLPITLYTLFVQNTAFLKEQALALQKYFAFAGVGLSSLGTVYSFFSNNSVNQQVFLTIGFIFVVSAYHQHVLERSLLQAQMSFEDIKKRLTLTEITLSDRERLLKTLSDAMAQLTISTKFFEGLKNSEGDIKLIQEHLSSIEKVTKVILSHFKKTDETTAATLSKISFHLEKLHKEDVDIMALLIEIHKLTTEIKENTIAANSSLEELKAEKTIASKQQLT